jgi:hypothetical protein
MQQTDRLGKGSGAVRIGFVHCQLHAGYGAATGGISQNVAKAADGSQSVAGTISGVTARVDDAGKSAEDVLGATRSVTASRGAASGERRFPERGDGA